MHTSSVDILAMVWVLCACNSGPKYRRFSQGRENFNKPNLADVVHLDARWQIAVLRSPTEIVI